MACWQQTEPFAVNLVLTDKLRRTFADQARKRSLHKENPMAFYFSRVFIRVPRGYFCTAEQFTLDFSVENNQWQLVLVPKQSPLNSVFKAITLSGKTH